MVEPAPPPPRLWLEGTNLGRGRGVPTKIVDGVEQEGHLAKTVGLTVWLIADAKHYVLPTSSLGHFHSGRKILDIICQYKSFNILTIKKIYLTTVKCSRIWCLKLPFTNVHDN